MKHETNAPIPYTLTADARPIPYRLTGLAVTTLGRATREPAAPSLPKMPPRGSDLATWRAYFDALAIAHGRAPLAAVKGGAK